MDKTLISYRKFYNGSETCGTIADITCFGVLRELQHIVVFYLTLAAYCDLEILYRLAISV